LPNSFEGFVYSGPLDTIEEEDETDERKHPESSTSSNQSDVPPEVDIIVNLE
jgi:hypothetical protein